MRIKDDLDDCEQPAWFKSTEQFRESGSAIGDFSEDGDQDSTIETVRGELAVTETGSDELDVLQAGRLGLRFRAGKHARLNVQGDNMTSAADTTSKGDSQTSGAAPCVQNSHPWRKTKRLDNECRPVCLGKWIVKLDEPTQPNRTRQRLATGKQAPWQRNQRYCGNDDKDKDRCTHGR